ncbi:MAG TPA: hypothetical protein VGC42_18535 [Kofleriaceae bacterium]
MRRLLVVAIALASCAKAPSRASESPVAAAPAGDPHAQIEALDRQIADDLAQARLTAPAVEACSGASCAQAMSSPFTAPAIGEARCKPAASERCTTACTLSTSICDDQDKICELARQLAGDDWAANKCASARASCATARDACCSCVL